MNSGTVKEEYAVILDFLPNGYSFDNRPIHKKTAIAQALSKKSFALLELVPKKDVHLQPYKEVYIGEGKRDQISHVVGRLPFHRLTETAKAELEFVIRDVIKQDEQRFISFFNKSQPLSTRMHQIELLPGVGKKHMWQILELRNEKPFENFEDIRKRVKLMPDPEKTIVKRILLEIKGDEKYHLFVER